MHPIVEKNVLLMRPRSKLAYNMHALARRESMGGNAGSYGHRPCVGVNFNYDPLTGEILCFGNYQELPPALRERGRTGLFRIVMDVFRGEGTGKYTILQIIDVSGPGLPIIQQSVAIYNREFGFPIAALDGAA